MDGPMDKPPLTSLLSGPSRCPKVSGCSEWTAYTYGLRGRDADTADVNRVHGGGGGITVLLLAADVSTGESRADLSSSLTPELTASPPHQDEDLIYLSSSGRWSQCRMVRILLSRGITLQESTPALEITLYSPKHDPDG